MPSVGVLAVLALPAPAAGSLPLARGAAWTLSPLAVQRALPLELRMYPILPDWPPQPGGWYRPPHRLFGSVTTMGWVEVPEPVHLYAYARAVEGRIYPTQSDGGAEWGQLTRGAAKGTRF